MFYVEKLHQGGKRELAIIHIGPPIIVFLAFLGITVWSWLDANHTVQETKSNILNNQLEETKSEIQNQLETYQDILRAGAGLFNATPDISRTDWKNFIDSMEAQTRYEGIAGIGYTQVLSANEISVLEQRQRQDGVPSYSVHPKGIRAEYSSVVYLEPRNQETSKTLGYDMYTEPSRKEAMDLAEKTGTSTLTHGLTLYQDLDKDPKKPGLVMFTPVFTQNTDNMTEIERMQNIKGFIFAQIYSDGLLKPIAEKPGKNNFAFKVHDINQPNDDSLLFESQKYRAIRSNDASIKATQAIDINNQTWLIDGTIDQTAVPASENDRPLWILWGGTLLSLFLAAFIYSLLINRTRALASKESSEIQNAKDELLALASHQLRTPATGVKQYLGLLREGYAGALNKDQRLYINKAYESNERQLQTINQMLFVARYDTGDIKLAVRHLELSEMIRDILDEFSSSIKEKKHILQVMIPKQKVYTYADEQYLRMAIENVLSNAIKYTPVKGTVKVSVVPLQNSVDIIIEDNGVGVGQEDLTLLFRKFSRIPNELTGQVSGSGIGLYLTKSIIKAHGGKITFESISNVGSSVTISLPSKLPKKHKNL